MNDSLILEKRFDFIKTLEKKIEDQKNTIRNDFDVLIINFFKEKGFIFSIVNNPYDPTNRYYLDMDRNVDENLFTLPPIIKVYHNTFTVEFNWWKTQNKHITKVLWDPFEMSLEDFYYEKLEKTFNLL